MRKEHVDELLSRSMEEPLTGADAARVDRHLGECDRCTQVLRSLRRTDVLLAQRAADGILPEMPHIDTKARHAPFTFALGGFAALGALMLVVAIAGRLTAPGGPPNQLPSAGQTRGLFIVVAEPQISQSAPGGNTVALGAYTRVLALPVTAGNSSTYDLEGFAWSELVRFDERSAVAYWRTAQDRRSPPFELVLLDLQTGGKRVIDRLAEGAPLGAPVWSTDRQTLHYATSSSVGLIVRTSPVPAEARLIAADVASGQTRVVASYRAQFPVIPAFANGQIVGGFRWSDRSGEVTYEVVDLRTGATVSRVPSKFFAEVSASARGLIAGVDRPFEAQAHSIDIVSAEDGRLVTQMDTPGFAGAIFWPDTDGIVYGVGTTLRSFDVRTETSRTIYSGDTDVVPIAFDETGRRLIARYGREFLLLRRSGDALEREMVAPPRASTAQPLGFFGHE